MPFSPDCSNLVRGQVVDHTGAARGDVVVSDGHTVTVTDADGSFELAAQGPYVFLTRPAGWAAEPWYLPSDVAAPVFTLRPVDAPLPYRFVHLSDLHMCATGAGTPTPQDVADLLTELAERVPDAHAVVITGDLTQNGVDVEYAEFTEALAACPLPVHLMAGNHDHLAGANRQVVSRTGYLVDVADTAAYERHLGPRWYSFDLPELHVVVLDWHSHELGLDHTVQDGWLRADLAAVPAGRPWILLAHDQPGESILGDLPTPPLATFSGHWHTSRVTEHEGVLHVSTPSALFPGLDHSPPALRVVTWDGARVALDTQAIAARPHRRATFAAGSDTGNGVGADQSAEQERWRHQLPGSGHRAGLRLAGDLLLAPVRDENRPAGGVDAIAVADGSLVWRTQLRSAVKSTPIVVRDLVVAVEVAGDVVGLSLVDGTEWWRAPSVDPLRRYGWAEAVSDGQLVVIGDQTHLRALDVATGEVRWERSLSPHHNLPCLAAPVIAGDTVLAGYWPWPPSFVGLDLATGQPRWPDPLPDHAEARFATSAPVPLATPLLDPLTGDLFAPALGRVVRVDAGSGRERWSTPLSTAFNPATPVSTPDGIAIVDAGSGVLLLDREDGTVRWHTSVAAAAPFPMAAYASRPHPLLASPVLRDDLLLVPALDGSVHTLSAKSGEPVGRIDVGAPVAAPVTVVDDLVVALRVDGVVTALDLNAVRTP